MVKPTPPGGVFDGPRHLYAVRVYYEDTDLSGITYHANYLRWFERARSDLLRMLKIDQRAAIEAGGVAPENGDDPDRDKGGAYAVSEINLKYLRPAKLDDDVVIETTCTALGAASCRMHQIARRGDDVLCEASLRVGFITLEGRPRRQPAEWRAAFDEFMTREEV
ncbi:hotdog domain-containing protein [Erythrobacter sp. Alg231-14]|uniref:hotdog domain-containing protein n=1 Tax=Erythrobacter sp. Alg231-14 TaxID=1922225 RepID=UPI000D55010E